jgi:hypothetical protein
MALTGSPDLPLGPPERLVDGVEALALPFVGLDAVALLAERAALMGLWRRGTTSCGGSCRLFETRGGWLAVSLPRDDDMDTVPAWLELEGDETPTDAPTLWATVGRAVGPRDAGELVERAELLGLPVSLVAEAGRRPGVMRTQLGDSRPEPSPTGLRVVDLSALWAGPICGDLLARRGADVIKVESTTRPDGARRGPAAFFDLLNGSKRSVALDFTTVEGRELLQRLVRAADVVIEASRPRALAQLGIEANEVMAETGGPRVWISITGYGRARDRVAFGDDAAAAGGLVAWAHGRPRFCADAVADPLSGLAAAGACLDALASRGRWLLDVSMADVSAEMAGPTLDVPDDLVVAEPRARRPARSAPALGADTDRVLDELGLS